jgi:hypothetical protein
MGAWLADMDQVFREMASTTVTSGTGESGVQVTA